MGSKQRKKKTSVGHQRCSLCMPSSGWTNLTSDAQHHSRRLSCIGCSEGSWLFCTHCTDQSQRRRTYETERGREGNGAEQARGGRLHSPLDSPGLHWTQLDSANLMASLPALRSWVSKQIAPSHLASRTYRHHSRQRILTHPHCRPFSTKVYETPIISKTVGTKKLANVARGTSRSNERPRSQVSISITNSPVLDH